MSKSYWEKLKDPRWQKKRLEALQEADFNCQICHDGESTLHVHHKQYFKGREPWEYDVQQLAVLCESCHSAHHESEDELNLVCSYLPVDGPRSRETVAALVAGFSDVEPPASYDHFTYYAGAIAYFSLTDYGSIDDLLEIADTAIKDGKGLFEAMLAYAKSRKTA